MSETNTYLTSKKPYMHASKEEFDDFFLDLSAKMNNHPHKLDSIMTKYSLHRACTRKEMEYLKKLGVTERAEIAAHLTEVKEDYNEEVFNTLILNISNTSLKRKLHRDYNKDGHKAYMHIAERWDVTVNDSRPASIAQERKEHVEAGLTKITLDAFTAFVDKLTTYNTQLASTPYKQEGALDVIAILDAMAAVDGDFVSTFKITNVSILTDFDKTYDLLKKLLEERDRTVAKTAATEERRALIARKETPPPALEREVTALRAELTRIGNLITGEPRTIGAFAAARGGERTTCADCNGFHRGPCVGKGVALGTMTRDEAKGILPDTIKGTPVDDARKESMIDAAVKRYTNAHPPDNTAAESKSGVPAVAPRPKKLVVLGANVVVVNVGNAAMGGRDIDYTRDPFPLRLDSGAEQTMFNHRGFFPFGTSPVAEETMVTFGQVGSSTKVTEVGTAVVVKDFADGTTAVIHIKNALLVLDLREPLVDTIQWYREAQTYVNLKTNTVDFEKHGFSIPFDTDRGFTVRMPNASDLAHLQNAGGPASTAPFLTRGKSLGPAGLSSTQTIALWQARTCLGTRRLRDLPTSTADAPACLANAKIFDVLNDESLTANMPKLHVSAAGERVPTTHSGEITSADFVGPFPPSKHFGNRYVVPFVDVHSGTYSTSFAVQKSEYPKMLMTYFLENQNRAGCDFTGGLLYQDNEIVLNSKDVKMVTEQYGVTMRNACEYSPWQNGYSERSNRTLESDMREMMHRGGAGDEYWDVAAAQASLIENSSSHAWTGPGTTPHELRTGRRAHLGGIRVMFCLAYARVPPAKRLNKLKPQALRCMHLGTSRNKPGYLLEILDGERKGELITTDQVIFLENVFPLKNPDADPGVDDEEYPYATEPDPDDSANDDSLPTVVGSDTGSDVGSDDDAPAPPLPAPHAPRRSVRTRHAPVDYGSAADQLSYSQRAARVVNVLSDMAAVVSLSSSVTHPSSALQATRKAPTSFSAIARMEQPGRDEFYTAHYKEVDGLFDSETLIPVYVDTLPSGAKILPLHSHFKYKSSGCAKGRTCLGGNHLVYGIDYNRTFSPTVNHTTFRGFCAAAAAGDCEIHGGDIPQAYTQSDHDIDGEPYPARYARMPEGYAYTNETGRKMCVKVANLYGDPVMGRRFNKSLDRWLVDTPHDGWSATRSEWDHCLYTIRVGDVTLRMVLYVDDVLVSVPRTKAGRRAAQSFERDFHDRYGIEFDSDFSEFLSIGITQNEKGITLDALRYLEDVAAQFFPGGVHHVYETPTLDGLAKAVDTPLDPDDALASAPHTRYHQIVGTILYLAVTTRPDLAWAAAMLSRRMATPTSWLLLQAERALMYAHSTRRLGITYKRGVADPRLSTTWAPPDVEGGSDSDWSVIRSMSGWGFAFVGGIVAWGAKKQPSIALSTMEAEIMAGSAAACEAVFLRGLFTDLGFPPSGPTTLLMDNTAAIDLAHDPTDHSKAKHIERRHLHIRELRARKIVDVRYVKSEKNAADIFTKHIPRSRFQTLRAMYMSG